MALESSLWFCAPYTPTRIYVGLNQKVRWHVKLNRDTSDIGAPLPSDSFGNNQSILGFFPTTLLSLEDAEVPGSP